MLFYEIKLINPQTKEVYYKTFSPRPLLPSNEILNKFLGAVIVINTKDNRPDEKKLLKKSETLNNKFW